MLTTIFVGSSQVGADLFCGVGVQACILKTLQRTKPCCPLCRRALSHSDMFSAHQTASDSNNTTSSKTTVSSRINALLKLFVASREQNPLMKSIVTRHRSFGKRFERNAPENSAVEAGPDPCGHQQNEQRFWTEYFGPAERTVGLRSQPHVDAVKSVNLLSSFLSDADCNSFLPLKKCRSAILLCLNGVRGRRFRLLRFKQRGLAAWLNGFHSTPVVHFSKREARC